MTKYQFPKQIAIVCKHISEQLQDIQTSNTKLQSHDQEFLTLLTSHLTTYLNRTHSGSSCECFVVEKSESRDTSLTARDLADPDTTLCHCENRCRSVCQVEISHLRHRLLIQHQNLSQALEESVRAVQARMTSDMAQLNLLFEKQQQVRKGWSG